MNKTPKPVKKRAVPHRTESQMWESKCKLYALAELVKTYSGEPALNQDEVHYGIGAILESIAKEIDSTEK